MAMSNDHDSFLAAKKTALAHLTKFIEIVPRYVLRAAEMGAKRFPYTFLVSCEFPAGVWMLVAVVILQLTDLCKKSKKRI